MHLLIVMIPALGLNGSYHFSSFVYKGTVYISSVIDYIPVKVLGLTIQYILFLLNYFTHKWQGPKCILGLQDFSNICVPFCIKAAN